MSDKIIKLAVMAVGGQGGGVLTNWIEAMARAANYAVQATSVAGVAQRTGATIYYVEMAPMAERMPVFSLAPAAGDVDILIAAEMMETGRAILRGFVTPDRTTLIASSHRALAVSEKATPGDGIANADEVRAAAEIAAQNLILLDMEQIAVGVGSVISASLFGALAASGSLPFERSAFEDAIRASGKSTGPSLAAFAAGFDAAKAPTGEASVPQAEPIAQEVRGGAKLLAGWNALVGEAQDLPESMREMALSGLRKVVDFQDLKYGRVYLDHVRTILTLDNPAKDHVLTREAAKYIANAMAYDDLIRVADLKSRANRFARVRTEMNVTDDNVMHITEFMHPGAGEIVGLLPARLGKNIENSPRWMDRIGRMFGKSRRMRSDTIPAFAQLYFLGGLRRWRLRTHRHAIETAHLAAWLDTAKSFLPDQYDLAVEVIRSRRLVKGYSDTHARGKSKFDQVLQGIALVSGRDDAADWAHRLREAALQDEKGAALDGALETIRSFS